MESVNILDLEGSPLKRSPAIKEEDNPAYFEKLAASFRRLFDIAREKNELQFAFALMPENRNIPGEDWSHTTETFRSIEEFLQFTQGGEMTPFKVRTSLSYYAHLGSAEAFYEVPMNLLRIAQGGVYDLWPLGWAVTPERNETSVIAAMREAAGQLGLSELEETIASLFDFDLVQAYLHGDYVLWNDGVHLGRRHLGDPQLVDWQTFNAALNRALGFFQILRQTIGETLGSYREPTSIEGIGPDGSERVWQIQYDVENELFTIKTIDSDNAV
jgi:hypothetical protein